MHEDFENFDSKLAVYTDKDYFLESNAFYFNDEQYKRALKMYFDLKYIYHDEHKAINKLTDILYQRCFFYIKANAELDVNRDSLFDVYTDYFVEQGIIKRIYDFICNNDTEEQYAELNFIYSDLFNQYGGEIL
ncbi:hypothetical protein ACKEKI_005595 [Klebsiella pneumoniae]|uniref:Uncharacterized protein n=2 Tax=Klebsiella pneumoniae TaxID=573 RepID=A0A486P665_KLEPN|nr:hypothetical protein [Salmonella enterica]EKT8160191.1 hypothetical protein [Klebsiella pneumoniae]HCJ7683044.1 hypothetical protein [Citrobacter freundii]HDK6072439.1 hypothetical protein [Klebsiella variicola]EKE1946091.1 hypothetical protein [Salmonella enterica]